MREYWHFRFDDESEVQVSFYDGILDYMSFVDTLLTTTYITVSMSSRQSDIVDDLINTLLDWFEKVIKERCVKVRVYRSYVSSEEW